MRSIWKGHVQFYLVTIPVRIYNSIDSGQNIGFNLLTKEGHHPVGYEKKDKITGEPLKNEDIVKGYEYEPGQFVIIEQEDLNKIKLKSEKVIEIQGFVNSNEVHPTLFESPYFLGPDGDVAAKTYGLLCATLKESGKVGVGKVVLRDRETPVLITPHERGILLYRLRYPSEIKNINDVPNLLEVKAEKEQLKLAKTLVDSMTTRFTNMEMKDHYYDAVKSLIDAKVAGKEIVAVTEEEPEVVDIMTALKASIDAAKKKPMEKATGMASKEKKGDLGKAKRKAS
ncbi:MAG: Ku protein [Cytophagales bacterium]